MAHIKRAWWKEAVFYQIYPRSFADSNGDGIGDLRGLIGKLDYLSDLGIGALWISPICQSPNRDNGYDISDYCAINPEFGTLADFDRLTAEAHARDIRIIFDMVCNHSSDQHPWFIEARASKTSATRDLYIWRDGRGKAEPNNWQADFGGSAWTLDPTTGQYYLGVFSPYQPDLNWENPEVRNRIYETMCWWTRHGVDGFRLDVINFLSKAPGLPDAPIPEKASAGQKYVPGGVFYVDQPGIHPLLQEMRQQVFAPTGTIAIGECHGRKLTPEPETGGRYIREERGELDMMFHFDIPWFFRNNMVALGFRRIGEWCAAAGTGGWTTLTFNNHDMPRQVSSIGDDGAHRVASAKAIALLLLTAPGTPFLLQGEEIGMTNIAFPSIDDYRDISTHSRYQTALAEGKTPDAALREIRPGSRDNGRTPMQWDASRHAGFTTGTPWIGVNPNYREINVAAAEEDSDSVLHWYRRLIALRTAHMTLVYGDYALLEPGERVFAYARTLENERFTVLLNWSGTATVVELPPDWAAACVTRVASNYPDVADAAGRMALKPWEARLYCR